MGLEKSLTLKKKRFRDLGILREKIGLLLAFWDQVRERQRGSSLLT
jgi:hypothetical protein